MPSRDKIKNLIYFFLNIFGSFIHLKRASILMYHSVGKNDILFNMAPEDFERQMKHLKNNDFNVISFADLIHLLKSRKIIPKKTVILTFDDGHEDNYPNVLPILKKYNFPATVFLNTGLVGGYYFSKTTNTRLKMLDWRQIEEMRDSGLIDFQPHGINHPRLAKLSLKEAETEITESKKTIEEKLNKECRLFAFPYGSYNQEIIEILKRNNFQAAGSVEEGLVKSNDNPYTLKRNFVYAKGGFFQFKGKLGASVEIFNFLKSIFRR